MIDSFDSITDNNIDVIELNGHLDDLVNTIKTLFDDEITTQEAKFIIGVLVEKKNIDQNIPLERSRAKEFEKWVESKATDFGQDTRFGTIIIQTSRNKLEAIHAVYIFLMESLVFQNPQKPISYFAVFSIEVIWFLVTSIKLVTGHDERLVMAVFLEKNAGKGKPILTYKELENALYNKIKIELEEDKCYVDEEKTSALNEGEMTEADEEVSQKIKNRIRAALRNLVHDQILVYLGGDYWQFG